MPQYKYRCTICAHEFEDIRGVNEPNPSCPLPHDTDQFVPTVRIPSIPGPPQGGSTPKFYR